ncbi:MAG: RNase adapter RapZ [Chromatiales bacterium]|nr:RNase adapter RapZ [Chromatiales bacterium]MDX9766393.1 RNase adapter RapZ [Ectothiorhodospiraceae bacterium]
MKPTLKLVIVSGLSGSGKTVALHALEDEGYYCIDNLHPGLMMPFVQQLMKPGLVLHEAAAVGIDARSGIEELDRFDEVIQAIQALGIEVEVIFLQATDETLLRRFSETRRRHPLARKGLPLMEAIHLERQLLAPIVARADLVIDTTRSNIHQLVGLIGERIRRPQGGALSLLFQSFGYKHGIPVDSDFVFDVRCLPNPHWEPALRDQTGLDPAVVAYFEGHPVVDGMYTSLCGFLENWIPRFEADNRGYLTVSVGCTGGRHRSVYLTERLAAHFRKGRGGRVSTRHRELS